jgi:hypothetical protein
MEVYHSDFIECDSCPEWTEINKDNDKQTLVLANSTCFEKSLLKQISEKCAKLKKGDWIFTLTKKLITLECDISEEEVSCEEKDEDQDDDNENGDELEIPQTYTDDASSGCSMKIKESEPFGQGPEWECVMSIKREMSWGLATVHL